MSDSTGLAKVVSTPFGDLAVRDYPGDGNPFVLLHGFPDDSKIYDRLVPELSGHRVVTFDFAGYGQSEHRADADVEEGQRVAETAAVVDQLGLEHVTVVGHDAGGPVAVEYAAVNADRVSRLGLLNCYFGSSPTLRFPEMIRLLAEPNLVELADAFIADPRPRKWLLEHTARRFGYSATEEIREKSIIPQFFGSENQRDSLTAIRAWTGRLLEDVELTNNVISSGALSSITCPVDIAFGVNDPYLNSGVADHLANLFVNSRRHSIAARHWVQWDEPRQVAEALTRNP
ncbi:alpha/beta fold hydrolase [Streptomyces sp. SAS_275]|uniref:alpha/beta fold hydrolase n=1 Tax=Streptomyces sp. SAS_275 TaxID=3412746 RepID=UPI00403C5D92